MSQTSSVYEFVGIGEMAETTTQLLSLNLRYSSHGRGRASGLEQVEHLVFQQARDYLSQAREGFVLSVRTAQIQDRQEIQYLLDRVLLDWQKLSQELGWEQVEHEGNAGTPPETGSGATEPLDSQQQLEYVRTQLMAFGMAAIAFGYLPRLPAEQITFPHNYSDPPTYSDIPAPVSPGEILWRIEELEEMVWQCMASDMQMLVQHRYGSLRRTYGFFETSAWLARREAERFGIKRQPGHLVLL